MRKAKRYTHDFYLIGVSLFVALTITLSQLNIHEFMRVDRLKHILITGCLFLLLFLFQDLKSRRFLPFVLVIFGIGFLKEFTDPQFDLLDILANTLGLFLAIGIQFFFTQFQMKKA